MKPRTAAAAACLFAALGSAAWAGPETFPVVGSVGFVWTAPRSARCAPIGEAEVKGFKACTFNPSGAFGLPIAYHACERKQGGELLAFRTAADCQEALETMKAHAP